MNVYIVLPEMWNDPVTHFIRGANAAQQVFIFKTIKLTYAEEKKSLFAI